MRDQAMVWIEEVIARHGSPDGPDRVRIPLSQAALARATDRSAGTVTYYVRRLGPLIERRDGALVVDIAALAQRRAERRARRAEVAARLASRFGQVTADGSAIELVDGDGPPTVRAMADDLRLAPSSVQRHLHALQDAGHASRDGSHLTLTTDLQPSPPTPAPLPSAPGDIVAGLSAVVASLAETARRLADLAGQLLVLAQEPDKRRANPCAPEFAREHPDLRAEVRDLAREENTQTSPDQEKERKLSVFLEETPRNFARSSSRSSRTEFASRLSREQLDALLIPLQEACKRYGNKPGFLDDNGRRYLARLSEQQLRAGINQIIRKLKSNTAIERPFGLLVARAKAGDEEFFTPPPANPPPASVSPDVAGHNDATDAADLLADDAIAAMSEAERDVLDAQIAASLSPTTYERLRRRPHQLARLRREAWRQRNETRPDEEH